MPPPLQVLCAGAPRALGAPYCCDVLSHALAHLPAGGAWCTVQANINAVAVAVQRQAGCLVLCEGGTATPYMLRRARQYGLWVLATPLPAFEAAQALAALAPQLPPAAADTTI